MVWLPKGIKKECGTEALCPKRKSADVGAPADFVAHHLVYLVAAVLLIVGFACLGTDQHA
jgi:hypothetical protein